MESEIEYPQLLLLSSSSSSFSFSSLSLSFDLFFLCFDVIVPGALGWTVVIIAMVSGMTEGNWWWKQRRILTWDVLELYEFREAVVVGVVILIEYAMFAFLFIPAVFSVFHVTRRFLHGKTLELKDMFAGLFLRHVWRAAFWYLMVLLAVDQLRRFFIIGFCVSLPFVMYICPVLFEFPHLLAFQSFNVALQLTVRRYPVSFLLVVVLYGLNAFFFDFTAGTSIIITAPVAVSSMYMCFKETFPDPESVADPVGVCHARLRKMKRERSRSKALHGIQLIGSNSPENNISSSGAVPALDTSVLSSSLSSSSISSLLSPGSSSSDIQESFSALPSPPAAIATTATTTTTATAAVPLPAHAITPCASSELSPMVRTVPLSASDSATEDDEMVARFSDHEDPAVARIPLIPPPQAYVVRSFHRK
eukprot:comp18100_c0_seq1/m.31741 comp18100_c0_seq1/g.31741  ORF comp18100_c0_seq1/g.31741 comp18100_c0_seq1/m.31741 type:complete len:420 (+) comp18100_c0_seq1:180-1439(+)